MPLPYFPFYRDDWRSSTAVQAMTLEEEGAYIRLVSNMWGFKNGCWLPNDDVVLARIVKALPEKWQELRAVLIDGPLAVFEVDGDRLINRRLLEEWQKAEVKSQRATENIRARYGRSTDEEPTKNECNTTRDLRSQIPDPDKDPDKEKDKSPVGAADEKAVFGPETEPYRLALLLRSEILRNLPTAKVPKDTPEALRGWSAHIDRMIRLDGREPPDIERVMRWCQRDPFWQANILGAEKLRKQWDRLELQSRRDTPKDSPVDPPPRRPKERLPDPPPEFDPDDEDVPF